MDFLSGSMKTNLKGIFFTDFTQWKTIFENLVILANPQLKTFITDPYERPKGFMSDAERKIFIMEKKMFETIRACLPNTVVSCYKNRETSFDLWDALVEDYGRNNQSRVISPDEGIKEKLLKKEVEIQALQSQILNMENEREQMRLTIVSLPKKVAEFEDQQTMMNKLQVDHDVVIKMVDALREQCDKASQSHIPPVEKKKKSVKRMSQFTTYSLQKNKNKNCSEQSQSTKLRVDCCDHSGYSQRARRSVSFQKPKEGFKPTIPPESRKTKSCVYTRAQMFALAPSCCDHMVQRRRKDFVSLSQRKDWLPPVPRIEYRYETTRFNFRWNSISLDYLDASYKRLSKISSKIGTVLKWVPKAVV